MTGQPTLPNVYTPRNNAFLRLKGLLTIFFPLISAGGFVIRGGRLTCHNIRFQVSIMGIWGHPPNATPQMMVVNNPFIRPYTPEN